MPRPSLPTGHVIPGFPRIDRALHIDGALEVYRLADPAERILVHIPETVEPSELAARRLTTWWRALGADRVTVESANGVPAAFQAVLHLKGKCIGAEKRAAPPSEEDLCALLGATCDAGSIALAQATDPWLVPSLVWWDSSATGSAVPIYAGADHVEEKHLVRSAARLVYEYAAGIDVTEVKGAIAPLSRWVKTAGPRISGVLERCLSDGRDRIQTFDELRACLEAPAADKGEATESRAKDRHAGLAGVAGMHELRNLLEKEVIGPIREPERFKKYGLSIPNGVLLYGPPGCGKTWIARKLSEELGHFFVEVTPSEVASPYIHDTVLRIRELFETAVERAPSVMFIDEFEALVPSRADLGGHQQYKSEEVNEFLTHLNECAAKKVFVIAASNEPDKIDPAVRRTGRLDKLIYVGPPDPEARTEMLRMHLSGRPTTTKFDYDRIAASLEGYSASDIKFLVDQAARVAIESNVEISEGIVLKARDGVPPSVTAAVEAKYKGFVARG